MIPSSRQKKQSLSQQGMRLIERGVAAFDLRATLDLTALLLVFVLAAAIANAQSCIPPLYQGDVNSCQGINVKFLNKNAITDIDHFTVLWQTDNLLQTLPGSALGASHTGLPCNWSSVVTITQFLKSGTSCVTNSTGSAPHTFPCSLCSNANAGVSAVNAANSRDAQTDDAISAIYSDVDMTNGAIGFAGNVPLPTLLLGARVYVGNYEAGLFYVSPLQFNIWIPAGVPQGIQSVQVVTTGGRSLYGTVNIQPNSPGIFTQTGNGQGTAASLWLVARANGTQGYYAPGNLPPLNASDQVFFILYGTSIKGSFSTLYLGNGRSYDSSYTGATVYPGLKQMNYLVPVGEVWRSPLGAFVRVWNGTTKANGSWDSQGFDAK